MTDPATPPADPPGAAVEPVPPPYTPPDSPTEPSGLYYMTLTKVTSFLIMTQQRRVKHTGTVQQLEMHYTQSMTHNLLFGWWGIPFGLIWTPLALRRNAKAMAKVRQLAASGG